MYHRPASLIVNVCVPVCVSDLMFYPNAPHIYNLNIVRDHVFIFTCLISVHFERSPIVSTFMDRSLLSSIILVIIFSIKLYCAALLFFVILFHVVWSFVNLSYLLPWAVTYAALTGLTLLRVHPYCRCVCYH